MLKKLRVKFILMMMSFTILLLGSIFGLIYHFTAADLAQSSFEMMQAVALRPSRPERPGSAPDSVRLPFFTVEVSKTGAITAAGSDLYDLSDEDFLRELVLAAQADGKNDGLAVLLPSALFQGRHAGRRKIRLCRHKRRAGDAQKPHPHERPHWPWKPCGILRAERAAGEMGGAAGGARVAAAKAVCGRRVARAQNAPFRHPHKRRASAIGAG